MLAATTNHMSIRCDKSLDISSLLSQCSNSYESIDINNWISTWLKVSLTSPDNESIEANNIDGQIQYVIQQAYILISQAINRQLDQILHHPRFKKLEASWRGLQYLSDVKSDYDESLGIKIKVLNSNWIDLGKDLERAIEFDQSAFFKRVYSDEFDAPGGEPYGVILGDYTITHRPRKKHVNTDIDTLKHIADVASAALCPFIASADSSLFGLDSLRELSYPLNLNEIFKQREYDSFNELKKYEGTRFIGLTLPDMLMREPYDDDDTYLQSFQYQECCEDVDRDFLWGSAAYAFGSVLIRAFANTGWFADIRGGVHDFGEGGVVKQLTYAKHRYQASNIGRRPATNTQIDDFLERQLSDLGFIPLCSYHSTEKSVFYSNSSIHHPPNYTSAIATANAKLSSMMQYMMCVARFGHYIKIIGRDKIGSFIGPEECKRVFQNWLNQYTTSSDGNSSELKARYPLSMSQVDVKEIPGKPGKFSCVMHLQPHFQLDQLVSSIKLITELATGASVPKIA